MTASAPGNGTFPREGWRAVESQTPPLRFQAPADWSVRALQESSVSVVAPRPDGSLVYRPNLTIASSAVDGDLTAFGDAHLDGLERMLTDFRLIQLGDGAVGPFAGVRLTASFRQGVYDLTLDQWVGLADLEHVVTATAVAADFDYAGEVTTFQEIVASVERA